MENNNQQNQNYTGNFKGVINQNQSQEPRQPQQGYAQYMQPGFQEPPEPKKIKREVNYKQILAIILGLFTIIAVGYGFWYLMNNLPNGQ